MPAVDRAQHVGWPEILEEHRKAVLRVLDRGVLSGPEAPEIKALEQEFARFVGVPHCLALNSGTAALHCCAAAVGLEPGDEVIVPALTFVASAMAVAHQGATPVFCDVDPRTFNLDPDRIEELITERTKAIMAVHLHGLPCDMDEIARIARRHDLALIEDAAQAPGARYRDKPVGTLGDCAAFSLQATKNLSGGEGGLFVCQTDETYLAAARLRIFGEDVPPPDHFGRLYWSHGLGYNYRDHELSAALARCGLRHLERYNTTAQTNAEILTQGFSKLKGIVAPHVPADRSSVYHKYRVQLDPAALDYPGDPTALRDAVIAALRAEGVEAVLWQHWPLPAHPAFRRKLSPWHSSHEQTPLRKWDPASFPQATHIFEHTFLLGSERAPLTVQRPALMHTYLAAITKVLANTHELIVL